jgi:hypothetical protein
MDMKKLFLLGLTTMAVGLAPVASSAAAAASGPCKATSDEKSVYMRSLQTDLMVGALTCSTSDQYNSFIHQFQSVLKTDATHLQSYFKKQHGKGGADDLNVFVTHLANDESERSIALGQAAYCDNTARLFQTVLALPPAKVEDFAATMPISSEAPVRKCTVAATPPALAPLPAAAATPASDTPPAGTTDSATAPVQDEDK